MYIKYINLICVLILFVFGGRMNSIKKGKLLVILTVVIIAFGTSTAVASVTNGDAILDMLNITRTNGTTELMAVGDGNFTPLTANKIVIPVQNNTTNVTNTTNITTNDTNITKNIVYDSQVKNTAND